MYGSKIESGPAGITKHLFYMTDLELLQIESGIQLRERWRPLKREHLGE